MRVMYLKEVFDRWAVNYDPGKALEGSYPFGGYDEILAAARALITDVPGRKILDLGTGKGALVKPLYEAGAEVHALDFSEAMLNAARTAMPEAHFWLHDFSAGFPPELLRLRFDYVTAGYSLHHLEDDAKVSFLGGLRPLLAGNGGVLIADVAFRTRADLLACKAANPGWDEGEFYFVAEEIAPRLSARGFKVKYSQLSSCGGILFLL